MKIKTPYTANLCELYRFAVILTAIGISNLNAQTTTTRESSETKVSEATVKSVDKPEKKIELVTTEGKSLKLAVTDDTQVRKGKEKKSMSDISVGDSVGVTYDRDIAIKIDKNAKGEIPPPNPVIWPTATPKPRSQ